VAVQAPAGTALGAFIAGCEAAWVFFGGVFRVLVPDNASAIVADADAVNPRFTAGWLDYMQARGFVTDAARVRSVDLVGRLRLGRSFDRARRFGD
jgi:hypothetical protein